MNLIVVLGEKLPKNGQVSKILQNRLDKAFQLYKNSLIIVSGGRVQKECIHTEAYVMKKYLIDKYQTPLDRIITESKSQNTIENSKYTLKIIKQQNIQFDKIIVVSSSFHLKRVSHIFNYFYHKHVNENKIFFISSENGISGKTLEDRIHKEKLYLKEFRDEYKIN